MKSILHIITFLPIALLLQMCTPSVPTDAVDTGSRPKVEPDYTELDIPVNIAPLNFTIRESGSDFITVYTSPSGMEMVVPGKSIDIDVDKWHSLLADAAGDTVRATVYVRNGDKWQRFAPIRYHVAEEIDPYISYRHIEPLYMTYDVLNIRQRCLENFDAKDIYNNCAYLDVEGDRQCVNCHNYQDYNRGGNMQMHVRVSHGGTLIVKDGSVTKVDLKSDSVTLNGAYPSWHPSLPLIAYSTNDTWQHFHSVNTNKVEVQDAASGLILYDTEANTVYLVQDSPTQLETFPSWSPDGRRLYYISAKIPEMTYQEMANYRMDHYRDIKYDIFCLNFDPESRRFVSTDTVFLASEAGMSATFPRESPCGRFVMFCLGEYGTFHNFHHDADLYLLDRESGKIRALAEINSPDTESYHNFSSNGRWVIFSSRRDNGSYTRLYLAHFDADGRCGKPFVVPERHPYMLDQTLRSYNVPEFMVRPVDVSMQQWRQAVESEPVRANYGGDIALEASAD